MLCPPLTRCIASQPDYVQLPPFPILCEASHTLSLSLSLSHFLSLSLSLSLSLTHSHPPPFLSRPASVLLSLSVYFALFRAPSVSHTHKSMVCAACE